MGSASLEPLKSLEKLRKTKNPPATGAGGVLEKIDDLYQILNYLPASLLRDSFAKPGLGFPVPELRWHRMPAMHTNIPISGDHRVGCGELVWSVVDCMTC